MRCQKCGYISFDHLSACKSCGVDLTAVRDGLGLLPLEVSVPLFLQSLLKSHTDIPLEVGGTAPSSASVESTLPELEFNEVFELDTIELNSATVEMPPHLEEPPMSPPPPAQAQMKGHLDSALKVFEDIESLKVPSAASTPAEPEAVPDLEIDFVLDDDISFEDEDPTKPDDAPQPQTILHMPEEAAGTMSGTIPESPAVALSDDDLGPLTLDADWDKDLDLELDVEETVPLQAAATAKEATGAKGAESADESFVLELSEDDLESMILELEDVDVEKESVDSGKTSETHKLPREKS